MTGIISFAGTCSKLLGTAFTGSWHYMKMKQFTSGAIRLRRKSVVLGSFTWFAALVFFSVAANAQNGPAGSASEPTAPGQAVPGATPAGSGQGEEAGEALKSSPEINPEMVAALQARVKNLEAQIVDLRAMIGTFSSLGRGTAASGGAAPGGLNGQDGRRGAGPAREPAGLGPDRTTRPSMGPAPLPWQGQGAEGMGPVEQAPRAGLPRPSDRRDQAREGRASDRFAARTDHAPDAAGTGTARIPAGPALPAGPAAAPARSTDAQALYRDAYSHMLRRDYEAAENAFGALVKNHPNSRMAGNAQYWLGETYYVRGKYRPAADAFLKAYRDYKDGVKAPDSLMKLALSLTRLGQKAAACKTFGELARKYPDAPNHVKQRAGMEQRRAGCN